MYIDDFVDYMAAERRCSVHTLEAYKGDLVLYYTFLNENNLSEVYSAIRQWIVQLHEKKYTARSINRKIATLRTYYKYKLKKKLTTTDPTEKLRSLKIEKLLPQFLNEVQISEVLSEQTTIPKRTPEHLKEFVSMRDKLILEMFYMTGIRLSELIHLKHSSIDTNSACMRVIGKRSKERVIPLTKSFCNAIQSYIQLQRELFPEAATLFVRQNGECLSRSCVRYMTIRELAKVTTMQKKSPHVLRHTFATHMLNGGAELNAIKMLLGHANLSATQVYTHVGLQRLKRVYNQAHPRA